MNNSKILEEYYSRICSPLIFINETKISDEINAKIYLYNFTLPEELFNFKKVFQEYLIYYIENYDMIERLLLPSNNNEMSEYLINKSKKIRTNPIIPQRAIRINGLYGELFNDFYLRNICRNERFFAYISKRTYGIGNNENKGIDNVVCNIQNNSLEIVLSEAKFLVNIASSERGLSGDTEHVDLNYINDYMNIAVKKQAELIPERTKIINDKINALNILIEDENKNFIEAINELGYSIKFVYFAIFKNSDRNALNYEQNILEIINSFNEKISETGILKYSIEIVFIPTFNESMVLKNEMEIWN